MIQMKTGKCHLVKKGESPQGHLVSGGRPGSGHDTRS